MSASPTSSPPSPYRLILPTLLTLTGLSLPFYALHQFLLTSPSSPLLPDPLLSLGFLLFTAAGTFIALKPLLVGLTSTHLRTRDSVDWIVSNVWGVGFVAFWAWVLQTRWPRPDVRKELDHETRKSEVIALTGSAFVVCAAVLNYIRDEATPSMTALGSKTKGQEVGQKTKEIAPPAVVVTPEEADVLLNED